MGYLRDVPRHHFEVVASSRRDRIEAIFHKKRPIYSVQFHPEVSGKWGEKIILNFVKHCCARKKQ